VDSNLAYRNWLTLRSPDGRAIPVGRGGAVATRLRHDWTTTSLELPMNTAPDYSQMKKTANARFSIKAWDEKMCQSGERYKSSFRLFDHVGTTRCSLSAGSFVIDARLSSRA